MSVKQYAAAGGRARAESLSPARRSEIARRAAHRRWLRKRQNQPSEHLRDSLTDDKPAELKPEPQPESQPEPPSAPVINRANIPLSPREKAQPSGVPFSDHAGYRDPYEVWLKRQECRGWLNAW
jgi:hypothetical protein